MLVEQHFDVTQPPDVVWDFFQRVQEVARCMPGVEVTEVTDAGVYLGQMLARLGPVRATFEGAATVENDPAARVGRIAAEGVDREGGSTGQADVEYAVSANGSGSRVELTANLVLSGRLAQFGRPALVSEISNRMIADFTQCLEAKLSAASDEEASTIAAPGVNGLSLFFSSVFGWFRAALRRLFNT